MNAKSFLEVVRADCAKHKVELNLVDTEKINYFNTGSFVSGYFDSDGNLELACAIGKEESKWLPILVHEYSHMHQWLDSKRGKYPIWNALGKAEETGTIDDWLANKDVSNISEIVNLTQDLELDCETRTIKLITQLGLEVDIPHYIKAANGYIVFYSVMFKHRKWCIKGPYECQGIIDAVPDKLVTLEECPVLAEKLDAIYLEWCWPKQLGIN